MKLIVYTDGGPTANKALAFAAVPSSQEIREAIFSALG